MLRIYLSTLILVSAIVSLSSGYGGFKRAPIRFTGIQKFEDTVRIALVYNKPIGGRQFDWFCPKPPPAGKIGIADAICKTGTQFVGREMLDFALTALDSNTIPNIIVASSDTVTWSSVSKWWPGRLPHVIVHLNAGWYSCNGPNIAAILSKAAELSIGVVSIGDDAAAFANSFFHFNDVKNKVKPQLAATNPSIDLWLDLPRSSDTLSSPGIIRNAVDNHLSGSQKIMYKPYAVDGRCEADADVYEVKPEYLTKMTFLGYQKAKIGATDMSNPQGPSEKYHSIVALQEDERRAVAFSFQPQYLEQPLAVAQIIHDGIVWAAFAHTLRGKKAQYSILK